LTCCARHNPYYYEYNTLHLYFIFLRKIVSQIAHFKTELYVGVLHFVRHLYDRIVSKT
jgi:hypothetical protein